MPTQYIYLILALLVFGMNTVPAFMPPTWLVLAFFHIHFDLSLPLTVLIGATAATSGRIVLSILVRVFLKPFLPQTLSENYDALGIFFQHNQKLTIPIVFLYAFLPIPSNQVFIIAGLAKLDIRIIAFSFFIGRLISYSFWVSVAHEVADRLEAIFIGHFSSFWTLLLELIVFMSIFIIGKINWRKVLKIEITTDSSDPIRGKGNR